LDTNENSNRLAPRFSLKRTLVLVAIVETVIVAALFVYWTNFRGEFFPHPVNDDGTVSVAGDPLLVGYGHAITSPWTFSQVGGDTLMLNDLPFLPMRQPDTTADLQPADRDRLRTIKAILAESEGAYQAADTKELGMDAFAGVVEGYLGVFVDELIIDKEAEQITVDFADDLPPFTVTFLREPHWIEPEGMRRKKHFELIREFITWMEGNDDDAVFSFGPYHTELVVGDDIRKNYDSVLARLDAIAQSPRGLPSEADVRRELGDEDFVRWHDLVRDYLSWRNMHVAVND